MGQFTDKMTQKCVKMSLFDRVVTHFGSNESNDSHGVFSVHFKQQCGIESNVPKRANGLNNHYNFRM